MSELRMRTGDGATTLEQRTYVLSEQALAEVIEHIPDGRWEELSPEWFHTGPRGRHTLRAIVSHHAYDTAWVPDVLSGRTIAEVGDAHDGDLLGTDPRSAYRRLSERAIAAAEALEDPERIVHLTYGDFPAREYLTHITSFRCFRAYDIARWMGASTDLPTELVQGMWDELLPHIEDWRRLGVFGPAVPVPEDAPLQDRLLALVGRDPHPA
jgi:uncharacterized protein (TIGR03086 family)